MYEDDKGVQESEDPGEESGEGEDTVEIWAGGDEHACPIIKLPDGVSQCLGEDCKMWVPAHDEMEADCGFRLISLYAQFELSRILRYKELSE